MFDTQIIFKSKSTGEKVLISFDKDENDPSEINLNISSPQGEEIFKSKKEFAIMAAMYIADLSDKPLFENSKS